MTPTPDPADLDALLDDIQGAMGTDAYADKPGYNRGVKALSELRRILEAPTPDPAASALAAAITTAFTHEGMGPDDFDEWWLTPRGFGDRYAEPILAALREAGWTLVPAEGAADER